jgi:Flp pilus assembly protein TadB
MTTIPLQALAQGLAAISLAAVVYILMGSFMDRRHIRSTAGRLEGFVESAGAASSDVQVGSEVHRIRLAFERVRLDVRGREYEGLWAMRILLGTFLGLGIWWAGFPPLAALAGPVLGWAVVASLVETSWSGMRREIEVELPIFLSRMAGTIQATPNVLLALDEVIQTLTPDRPLRRWMGRLAETLQRGGKPAIEGMLQEADTISPSLGLTVFEIGRLWETGGKGFSDAFSRAAENLGEILDSRARADSKGAGMKSAIRIMLATLVLVVIVMLRNPAVAASIRSPIVQFMYLAIIVWVGIGWSFVTGMIEEAAG